MPGYAFFSQNAQKAIDFDSDNLFEWLEVFLSKSFDRSKVCIAITCNGKRETNFIKPDRIDRDDRARLIALLENNDESPHKISGKSSIDKFRSVTVILTKKPMDPPFTADDQTLLDRMIPLIGSILLLHNRGLASERRWQAMADTLNRLAVGIVMVNSDGSVLAMNRSAEEIIHSIATKNGGDNNSDIIALRRLMDHVLLEKSRTGTKYRSMTTLSLEDLRSPVTVLSSPNSAEGGVDSSSGSNTTLLLCDPEQSLAEHEELLRWLYGLTRLEAKIVVALVDGASVEECGRQLRISVHTIRAYLKQIFSKTGAHRQANLIRLVLASVGKVRATGTAGALIVRNRTRTCDRHPHSHSAVDLARIIHRNRDGAV